MRERRLIAFSSSRRHLVVGGRTSVLDADDGVISLNVLYEVKALIPPHQVVSRSLPFSL